MSILSATILFVITLFLVTYAMASSITSSTYTAVYCMHSGPGGLRERVWENQACPDSFEINGQPLYLVGSSLADASAASSYDALSVQGAVNRVFGWGGEARGEAAMEDVLRVMGAGTAVFTWTLAGHVDNPSMWETITGTITTTVGGDTQSYVYPGNRGSVAHTFVHRVAFGPGDVIPFSASALLGVRGANASVGARGVLTLAITYEDLVGPLEATRDSDAVPEPATWLLVGLGLLSFRLRMAYINMPPPLP